jgi:hypothetical protein
VLRRICNPEWTIEFASVAFVFSFAFLNYIHAGTPYIPGLMFLSLGIYLTVRSAEIGTARYVAYASGASLAISVCLWFPYIFAIPGALVIPLFYPERNMQRLPIVVRSAIACGFIGILSYGATLAHLHIYTVPAIVQWVGQGASSVAGVHGFSRAVFGFTHSFIDLGKDGVLFKRFLLHDAYNPVSFSQLIRLSLWKIALFYSLLLAIAIQLSRSSRGRNILVICAAISAPVVVFALFWFGGDIERYLPLYPAFFIALAFAIAHDHRGLVKTFATVFLATVIISNVTSLSGVTLRHQQQIVVNRIEPLLPLLKPSSRIVVVDIHDDLVNFSRSFPLNAVNRRPQPLEYALLNPGTPQTGRWRQDFAARVLATWNANSDIWVSKRLLASKPENRWGWVESSDRNVEWKDLPALFSQFDFGPSAGGDDGFLLLLPTQKDLAIIGSLQTLR